MASNESVTTIRAGSEGFLNGLAVETHDPPLRGLKTESELKIARIETQFPEGPQGFFRSMGENTMGLFSFRDLAAMHASRSAGPVSDSDIPRRSCQHHKSEIARSRHSKKALFAQESYL